MKIVLLSPAHPLRGGIAASSERLAQELQDQGHEVVIFSFSLQYPGFLFPGKTQYTNDPAPTGLRIRTMLNSINPLSWVRTGIAIAREKPDLVITRYWLPFMGPSLGTVLIKARFFARKKFRSVALVDNMIPHEKRPGDRLFSRYFIAGCDEFVVMSASVADDIRTFSKKSVRMAPHPVYDIYGVAAAQSECRTKLNLPPNTPLVLFFGFIRAYKGLDLLLEALAQTPTVHAIVAGECYESWEPYATIIEKAGLRDRVHLFTDFIPNDEVRWYFGAADLVVQPYKTATQSGISQIAYHFEKPMVVTRVGGLAEIVTDGVSGYVVDPTPGAIAEAMLDFFNNNRALALHEGVQKEKTRFSWGNLASVLLKPGL
ncbi:MAG: glycosyltransferase [Lewinellaceae bacterium]|nr:glycosyltransferase [Lewinellaceae bacterium]